MAFYNNFPGPGGPEQIFSDILDEDEEGAKFILCDDHRLLSIQDYRHDNEEEITEPDVSFIVRDPTGKFACDFRYIPFVEKQPSGVDLASVFSSNEDETPANEKIQLQTSNQTYIRATGEIPSHSPGTNFYGIDMVDELLH